MIQLELHSGRTDLPLQTTQRLLLGILVGHRCLFQSPRFLQQSIPARCEPLVVDSHRSERGLPQRRGESAKTLLLESG